MSQTRQACVLFLFVSSSLKTFDMELSKLEDSKKRKLNAVEATEDVETETETAKPLNLYLVNLPRSKNLGYDSYDSFIVCCENEQTARETHPGSAEMGISQWGRKLTKGEVYYDSAWIKPEQIDSLTVEKIGTADSSQKKEIILSSYNAG